MTDTDTDSTLGELTYVRTWDAPRSLVFACMTTPEHLTHFWGPVGVSTPVDKITVEPRVGGIFETVMVNDADGTEFPMRGVFVEFVPDEKMSWTEQGVEGGMVTSVTFNDLGDGRTETVTHQIRVPEAYRSPEAQAGMEGSFERMAAYLATL